MAKVIVIEPTRAKQTKIKIKKKLLRVCAYARVSTELEHQESSYEAQVEYYTEKIQQNNEWEFVKVYADEGKSGTQTDSRSEFNKMINGQVLLQAKVNYLNNCPHLLWGTKCERGKIDLVITKSISRFARNTVDANHN